MCSPPGPPRPLAASNAMSKNTLLRQYVAEPTTTTAAASPTLPLLAPLGSRWPRCCRPAAAAFQYAVQAVAKTV